MISARHVILFRGKEIWKTLQTGQAVFFLVGGVIPFPLLCFIARPSLFPPAACVRLLLPSASRPALYERPQSSFTRRPLQTKTHCATQASFTRRPLQTKTHTVPHKDRSQDVPCRPRRTLCHTSIVNKTSLPDRDAHGDTHASFSIRRLESETLTVPHNHRSQDVPCRLRRTLCHTSIVHKTSLADRDAHCATQASFTRRLVQTKTHCATQAPFAHVISRIWGCLNSVNCPSA
jgi:hypothetical protein